MKKTILAIAFISIFLFSCSTDFNITAPYKETMVIYGFLNPSDHDQYIRISKAYLGEGNALIMAQQKDSINYGDVLNVKLERINTAGNIVQTINLTRADTNLKDPGIFNNPYEVLFKDPLPVLTNGSNYKITVHNTQTGLTASSTTGIVGDFSASIFPPSLSMNFTSQIPYSITVNKATSNGWVYNFTLRFHYKEVVLATGDTTSKYVDWNFGDQVTGNSYATSITFDHINRPDFYRVVGNAIAPADTNLIKRFIPPNPLEFIFAAGSEDLYTYRQLTAPSYGLVQERPVFSNIENGVGLFTSRNIISYFRNMDDTSRHTFNYSMYTRDIHFY